MPSLLPAIRRAALGALVAAAAAACSADEALAPAAPAAAAPAPQLAAATGRYDLRLTSPNEGDEAALLFVSGAVVDSVTVPGGSAVVIPGELGTRVVLSGALETGVVATLWTRAGTGTPRAVVEQVTAAGTHVQRALDGYRVELAR